MTAEPLIALADAEYRRVWDRFYAEFAVHRSVWTGWLGIQEPAQSVTWSLASLPDDPDDERLDQMVEVVQQGLKSCVPPGAGLYALDYQHKSYRFSPEHVGGKGQERWPLSPYPDGDYYIYLSEDFRLGSFGHPWEESLCMFGQSLLDAVSDDLDEILGPPIRRSGKPVPPA